jgi:hypothetical protein
MAATISLLEGWPASVHPDYEIATIHAYVLLWRLTAHQLDDSWRNQ